MLDEHSPEMMRILAPYYDTMGASDRAVSDMDAEFAEAQEARNQEYEEQKAQQQKELEEVNAVKEEVNKQLAEQQAEQDGEEHKPNPWLEHEAYGAEEMNFVPVDEAEDGPVAAVPRVDPHAASPSAVPTPTASPPAVSTPAVPESAPEPAPMPSSSRGRMRHARFDPNVSADTDYDADDEYFLNRTWLE